MNHLIILVFTAVMIAYSKFNVDTIWLKKKGKCLHNPIFIAVIS
jgi:hypothetical protein